MCCTHLFDATAAILHKNAHHTSPEVERERTIVLLANLIREWFGGKLIGPGLEFSQDAGNRLYFAERVILLLQTNLDVQNNDNALSSQRLILKVPALDLLSYLWFVFALLLSPFHQCLLPMELQLKPFFLEAEAPDILNPHISSLFKVLLQHRLCLGPKVLPGPASPPVLQKPLGKQKTNKCLCMSP